MICTRFVRNHEPGTILVRVEEAVEKVYSRLAGWINRP